MNQNLYDVIIVGGGPAGLTAALYLARAQYRVLVVEKEKFGGQITITADVVNYPGILQDSGAAITETMRKQAQAFGAEFMLAEVQSLSLDSDVKTVKTTRGDLSCFGLLIATGAHPRKVGFTGETEFMGHGVAYCATCDGEFFTGLEVLVVGGGFAAAEEAVFLTKYASHVTVLVRGDDFSCAKSVADEVRAHPKISVLYNTQMVEVGGDHALRYATYKNTKTGEETAFKPADGKTFGVFVFAGYEPATDLVKDMVTLDDHGYIITDRQQKTNLAGVYAAGDVCVKTLRQVVTAVGDGALAATELERYAAAMHTKTGQVPTPPVSQKHPAVEASASSVSEQHSAEADGELLSSEMQTQLSDLFGRFAHPLVLKLGLDERPVSAELKAYMEAVCALSDNLELAVEESAQADAPYVKVYRNDGTYTGLGFHGVPGGHEFNSFVIGLYNAAGPGQVLDAQTTEQIKALGSKQIKILVSLSCTMCPELVMAAQKIAAENAQITAEVYDLNHFPALKDQYQVMSVPCLVINDTDVSFGKKNVQQLLELLQK